MKNGYKNLFIIFAAIALLCTGTLFSETGKYVSPEESAPALKSKLKPIILPERTLREFDPVTVIFPTAVGPVRGGAEDHPEKYVKTSLQHPGEYMWIDSRTLIFRPAIAWPGYRKIVWQAAETTQDLYTFLSSPKSASPADGVKDLDKVDRIALQLNDPLDPSELKDAISIEIRSLPGIDPSQGRFLTKDDFEVKKAEGGDPSKGYIYHIIFKNVVGSGQKVLLHLKLTLDLGLEDSEVVFNYSTQNDFCIATVNGDFLIGPWGTAYSKEFVLEMNPQEDSTIKIDFSADLAEPSYSQVKDLIRFTPAIENMEFRISGSSLYVSGFLKPEVLYKAELFPGSIYDKAGHPLKMEKPSSFYFHVPKKAAASKWRIGDGLMELFGPKQLPMDAVSIKKIDLRIYKIDPLDRRLWPFPNSPVSLEETKPVPNPGEEPANEKDATKFEQGKLLTDTLRMLGSPAFSRIVELPIPQNNVIYKFGLDIAPYLVEIERANKPGTYLVGYRNVDDSSSRSYVRIQVSDLSFSVLEEKDSVKLIVTSLKSALPVAGAEISLQSRNGGADTWSEAFHERTDSKGVVNIPKLEHGRNISFARIVVSKDEDILVLDPNSQHNSFADNYWNDHSSEGWLSAINEALQTATPSDMAFTFCERPVYKPEEPVYIKGFVRQRVNGVFQFSPYKKFDYLITGPGNKHWTFPVTLSESGAFNITFTETNLPTGTYEGVLQGGYSMRNNRLWFRKEAYKIPSFEVQLHNSAKVPSDKPFKVQLTAEYYAGGKVSGQPVNWRVTEFPFAYVPASRKGYLFSCDSRYNKRVRYTESRGGNSRFGKTDDTGAASIEIDPSLLGDTMPKQYIIEATVTGADEQTVTATGDLLCLPPFILGLKAERFVKKGLEIPYSFVALDVKNEQVEGLPVKVRLIKREWHAYFVESELSASDPKYKTENVDTVIQEFTVTNSSKEFSSAFKALSAGIYLIELEAYDKLGRVQSVLADIYVAGDTPVAWDKPMEDILEVVADKPNGYEPGEKATLIIRSPYPEGRVLVIAEKSSGNEMTWIDIIDSKAFFEFPISADQAPNIPLTFIYMSPRLQIANNSSGKFDDLEKPHTLAKTLNLKVLPVENQVKIKLTHPEQGMPGKPVDMEIQLSDKRGNPVSGEVTLWLVDQAVLSLGTEMVLDPLTSFIQDMRSWIKFTDLRGKILGSFKMEENPGGEAKEMEMKKKSILDKATVRKNFKTVAYYAATIKVDSSGKTKFTIPMPDNLTVFQIRAVAISGVDKFGTAKSSISMRLPLLVQASLPRFVRYGDELQAGGIGRVIVGPGGPGQARIKVENGTVNRNELTNVNWKPGKSEKLLFPITVTPSELGDDGLFKNPELRIDMAVSRFTDEASDAFSVAIPIYADRDPIHWQMVTNFSASQSIDFKPFDYPPQKNSVRGEIVLTAQMGILNTLGGVEYLVQYPYGCLEQRISKSFCSIALQGVYERYNLAPLMPDIKKIYLETADYIKKCQGPDGLFGYWPGSQTYVYISAYVMEFLCEAKRSGLAVDDELMAKLAKALKRALRSDYSQLIDHHEYQERVAALHALAQYGHFDTSYADELAHNAAGESLDSRASIYLTMKENKYFDPKLMSDMKKDLWNNTVFTLRDGKDFFSGMQYNYSSWGGIINSYEISSMATVYRSLAYKEAYSGKLRMIADRLISMYGRDGWGNTATTSAVLLALRDTLTTMNLKQTDHTIKVLTGSKEESVHLDKNSISASMLVRSNAPLKFTCADKIDPQSPPYIRYKLSYLPDITGDKITSINNGFIISKEISKVSLTQAPDTKTWIKNPGSTIDVDMGGIIEEHVQLVNPSDKYFVAVVCPMSGGLEPMNPNLLTSPPEAKTSRRDSATPTYVQFLDDKICYYFNELPKGTYDFYFRTRALTAGSFVEPPAFAEMMYEQNVRGNTPGLRYKVTTKE